MQRHATALVRALDTPRASVIAGVGWFALMAPLTPRAYGIGDAGEFVLALALAGVPHPTGYPIYVLAGSGFVHAVHALGVEWVHAANLWSTAGGAVAFALTLRLAARLVDRGERPPTTAAIASLGLSLATLSLLPPWIAAASFGEIHSWHLAWVALAVLTSLHALETLERRPEVGTTAGAAFRVGLVLGLGMAHHLTSLCVSVPLLFAILMAARRRGGIPTRVLGAGVAGALLPLTAYGWIAWRAAHPAAYQWPLLHASWSGIRDHLTAWVYARAFLGPPSVDVLARIGAPLAGGIAIVAIVGHAFSAPPGAARTFARALAVATVMQLAFVLVYRVPDGEALLVPIELTGLAVLPAWVGGMRRRNVRAGVVTALAAFLAFSTAGWLDTVRSGRRQAVRVDQRIRELWQAIPFDHGIVLWADDHYTRLRAYQVLDHDRTGLLVVNPRMLTWPGPREAFTRATGSDPLAGLVLRSDADLGRITENVRRRTRRPVVAFEELATGE